MTNPIAAITRLGIVLFGAWLLAALFVDLPRFGLEVDPVLGPLRALLFALAVYAIAERRALLEKLRMLADPAPTASAHALEARVLGGFLIAGFLLRFARFSEAAPNADEAQFIWFGAAETLAEVWRYERTASPHPPANFFLMHALLTFTWDVFWLRLPSLLSGTFLIWISHRFTRTLFGPLAGLVVAFLVAFSPGLVDLSRVARNYTPGFALLVTALYFYARFLRHERWRDCGLFAVFAPLAAVWHYGFIAVFVGADLVLAGVLLQRRKAFSWWLRVAACQLPLAAVLVFLYAAHISGLRGDLISRHQHHYSDLLAISPTALLQPAKGVWHYLMREPAATVLFLAGLTGGADLLVRRRWLELSVCLAPPAVAYTLAAMGVLPLGETRHSAYLFPFFFALAAGQAPQLLAGYRPAWERLRRRASPATSAVGGGPGFGAAVLGLSAILVLHGSLVFYRAGQGGWDPLNPDVNARELMPTFRVDDLRRSFELLEERAGPQDMVIFGFQGLMALRLHFEMGPLLDPTPEELARRDIRLPSRPQTHLQYEHAGVRYFWWKKLSVSPSPDRLIPAINSLRKLFELPRPRRVWVLRGAWERSQAFYLQQAGVIVPHDEEVDRLTNGVLFAIEHEDLVRAGPTIEAALAAWKSNR